MALLVTNSVDPIPDEPCSIPPNPARPDFPIDWLGPGYYQPTTSELLNDPRSNLDGNDGRLGSLIRAHAQMQDPQKILANALRCSMGLGIQISIPTMPGVPPTKVEQPVDPRFATPLAQLAVTGRRAFEKFVQWHPQDADLVQYTIQNNPDLRFNLPALQAAATRILDTAYATLWAIRANDANWRSYRSQLGWIAVSGEDDLPHRPVNIPSAPFPQYDLLVNIGETIATRYMIASAGTALGPISGLAGKAPSGGAGQPKLPGGSPPRSIPSDPPNIPQGDQILIYLHGGGSRLEESIPLAWQLIQAGEGKGIKYTVIAFDMLNSGFNTPFADPSINNSPGSSYRPSGDTHKPVESDLTYGYPVLDTEEQFIINFIETLDKQIGNIKNRIVAVMGGSLGGNMSLRLARRKGQHPYLGTIVAWSVTCIVSTSSAVADATGHQILGIGGDLIGKYKEPEGATTRHDFFDNLYNQPLWPTGPSQPQMWYRDGWNPCKNAYITRSKFDRFEYYTTQFRQWTYRLNYEMTIFSFQDGDVYVPNKAQGPPRFLSMTSRLLLASGEKDENEPFYTVYSSTCDVARKMVNTPGTTLFLKNTGHSIHDERPQLFAQQIVQFLTGSVGLSGVVVESPTTFTTIDHRTFQYTTDHDIHVTGKIDGGSTVKLISNRGSIVIDGKIDGGSKVELSAAADVVIGVIGADGDKKIDGGSNVSVISGGSVRLGNKIDNGATVVLFRARTGIDIGDKIDGGAKVKLRTDTGKIHVHGKIDNGSTRVEYWPGGSLVVDGGIHGNAQIVVGEWS